MISEQEAHKHYDRNTRVIRKGEPGWTSDNHLAGREGESYGLNPTSRMEQGIARRASRAIVPEQDPNDLEPGTRTVTGNGRDAFHWVVVEQRDVKRRSYAAADGQESDAMQRVWKLRFTERNGDR